MPTKSVSFGGVFTFPLSGVTKENKDAATEHKSVKERFNCGVLRSSLRLVKANSATLITIGLVGSKLRKREEHSVTTNHNNNVIQEQAEHPVVVPQHPPPPPTHPVPPLEPPPFLWMYSNNNSSHYNLCNSSHDTLVTPSLGEEVNSRKGFRKNLRGKWKRLVKKKPQQEVYTIPAELRPQLKQIYVY